MKLTTRKMLIVNQQSWMIVAFLELTWNFVACAMNGIGGHPIIGEISGHPIITHQTAERLSKCPWACSCAGLAIDCSHHGLTQVPQILPSDAEKL